MLRILSKKINKPLKGNFQAAEHGKITQRVFIRRKSEKIQLYSIGLAIQPAVYVPKLKFPQPTLFNTLFFFFFKKSRERR